MPVEGLFKDPQAGKVQSIASAAAMSGSDGPMPANRRENSVDEHKSAAHRRTGASAYRVIAQLPEITTILHAEQIMTSSVVTLSLPDLVSDALDIFQNNSFRHLPVVTHGNRLAGIISDRDVMRHLGGVSDDYRLQTVNRPNYRVEQLMQSRVLTASRDTDVRYIARLFVERRIGSMPIVANSELVGIVTRSDILSAVMRHFVLELWA